MAGICLKNRAFWDHVFPMNNAIVSNLGADFQSGPSSESRPGTDENEGSSVWQIDPHVR